MDCGCIFSLTSSPWVPYFMCSCVLISPSRLGSARAGVGVGFAVVGWFRRVRPPPPPLVLFRFRLPPLFFFLAFSGFARVGPGFLVLVFFSFPLRCVPLFASWLSNFHLIFIFTSYSFPFNFIFISLSGP